MKETLHKESRDVIGKHSGMVGLFGNLFLVIIKATVGFLSNSVAITADAINNMADCVSSLVTMLGFSLSSRGKDSVHPYGHGRMEYSCGFIISLLILITGASVGKDAFNRLLNPQQITVTGLTITALCVGIVGKVLMAWYVRHLNEKANSPALKAVQKDNVSDALVTTVTLAGVLTVPHINLPVDGILGILVSAVTLKSGLDALGENLLLLLGEGVDSATEDEIMQIVYEYIPTRSVEEISLHDYGPENKVAYIKIDPPPNDEANCISQTLSCIKLKLKQELQIDATLYWDIAKS